MVETFIDTVEDSGMRQLLTRRYLEGRTIKETAKLVGYSQKQAARLIHGFFKKMFPNVL